MRYMPRSSWKVTHPAKRKSRKTTPQYMIEYRIADCECIAHDNLIHLFSSNLDQWNTYCKAYRHYQDARQALPTVKKWMFQALDRHDVNIEYRITKK